jgi:alpha-2-macroglobulin
MKKQSDDMIIDILNTKLVYDPRGAYISPEGNMGRIPATAEMVRLTSILRPEMTDSKNPLEQILDNMTRFLSREKKSDGSYGSTRDTALVLEAFAARMKYTQDKPNFTGKIQLNGQEVYSQSFGSGNILETFTKAVPLTGSNDFSEYGFETVGTGKMFYSASLKTPLAASKTPARDEGFYIATEYYDLDAYNAIARKKEEEWVKHISGDLPYDKLQYPKEITEYLSPVPGGKIGQLLWVEYRMILSEHRDKVAFESMIPAGSEAVNTRLATETKTVSSDTFFDREEFLDDRYFGFAETLAPGEYRGGYAIRLTQAGRYEIPATKVFEFYTPEVF